MLIKIDEDIYINPELVASVDSNVETWGDTKTYQIVIKIAGGLIHRLNDQNAESLEKLVQKINETCDAPINEHRYVYMDNYEGTCACGANIATSYTSRAQALASHIRGAR